MARIGKKDIEIMIKHITGGDDYELAMQHFLNISNYSGVMKQSKAPDKKLRRRLHDIYAQSRHEVAKILKVEDEEVTDRMRFFYIPKYNFVHGMFMSNHCYGSTIFFPGLDKGVLSVIEKNSELVHYCRITAFRKTVGEA